MLALPQVGRVITYSMEKSCVATNRNLVLFRIVPAGVCKLLEWLTLSNLSGFLSVLEKARDLLAGRRSNTERLFDEVVDPIFNDLQPVVDDYVALFSSALSELDEAQDQSGVDIALENLRSNRQKMFTARATVRALVFEMTEGLRDRKLRSFLEDVSKVFRSTDDPLLGKMSRSQEIESLLKILEYDNLKKDEVSHRIRETLQQIERAFVASAQSHAHLRVRHSLKIRSNKT